MFDKCPGTANIRTPELKLKKCPQCDEEVEIFSNELQTNCPNCGLTIYNNIESCISWCKFAEECVGEETYHKLRKQKN
jgi:predicted RNA-binding Zn-ribbon protein involved in translation (DUF1610 family)